MRLDNYQNKVMQNRGTLSGFTLVELMTTLAIVAVLFAILFPVFSKVRESSRTVACISNMRQIGLGLSMYLDDSDNCFPSAAPWGAPEYWKKINQSTIQVILSSYVGNTLSKTDGFYNRPGVFACPSDTGLPGGLTTGGLICGVRGGKPTWMYAACSYEYYSENQMDTLHWQTDPPDVPWTALSPQISSGKASLRIGAPISAIADPATKAVMGDTFLWHMGDSLPDGRSAYINTLFADGHAKRVTVVEHMAARLQTLRHWHTYTEIGN